MASNSFRPPTRSTLESFAELVLPIAVQLSEYDEFQERVLQPVLAERQAALKSQFC